MVDLPLTGEEALELLMSMPQQESDMNHYLESEAIMRGLAERLGEDVEYWGMIGLLHDVDWALTRNNWEEHCVKAVEVLKEKGFKEEFIKTVQSHAYGIDEIPSLKDKQREEKIIKKIKKQAKKLKLNPSLIEEIFKKIIKESKK